MVLECDVFRPLLLIFVACDNNASTRVFTPVDFDAHPIRTLCVVIASGTHAVYCTKKSSVPSFPPRSGAAQPRASTFFFLVLPLRYCVVYRRHIEMAPPAKGKKRKQEEGSRGDDDAGPSSGVAAAKASKKGKEPAPPESEDADYDYDDDDDDDDEVMVTTAANDAHLQNGADRYDDEDDLEGLVGDLLHGEIDDEDAAAGHTHSSVEVLRDGFDPITVEDSRPADECEDGHELAEAGNPEELMQWLIAPVELR